MGREVRLSWRAIGRRQAKKLVAGDSSRLTSLHETDGRKNRALTSKSKEKT